MRDEPLLLGVDAGTSVVKAALFTASGYEVATAARRTPLITPQLGWSEVNMSDAWIQVARCIRDLLDQSTIAPDQIQAVGVAGNMVGAWLIDANGKPVRNAILWNDARSQSWIEQKISEQPTFMTDVFMQSGSVMQQGCTLPVLRWLVDHEPENIARTHAVLCCKDWLVYQLTHTIQLDATEVPGLPGSARNRTYSDEMIALHGLTDFRHILPKVVNSFEIVGEIHHSASEATGLKVGTPVIAGVGDVPAVTTGIGAIESGIACSILGTNILNGVVTDQPIFEPLDLGLLFTLPDNLWMRTMVNVAGTTNMDWFINTFCQDMLQKTEAPSEIFSALEQLAVESGIGARDIIYLPYLSTQGIITPIAEPRARAEFYGVHNEHGRGDFVRAVYEGVALSIRDSFAQIPFPAETIRLAGGGAKSPFWSQMIADCTGVEVAIAAGNEFGAKGVALIAGISIGWYADLAQACQATVQIRQAYQPDPTRQRQYDDIYQRYCALQKQLLPVWQSL